MREPKAQTAHRASLQFERLVFFSDAVFAIAITLLVLDLKLPPGARGVIDWNALAPKLFGFALSFAVIGVYWLSHHNLFGGLAREDGRLRWINLVFLASVVFLPFPTSVIAEAQPTATAAVLYAGSVATVGFLLTAVALAARTPKLMLPGETRGGTARIVARSLGTPIVFALSIPIAVGHPVIAMLFWWLAWPAAIAGRTLGVWLERRMDAK